jgi:hypothetical protein
VGERFGLALTVANAGNTAADDAVATLSTSYPGVSVESTASFPSIAASGQAESNPGHAQVSLSQNLPCGALIPFELSLEANGMSFSTGFDLRVGAVVATHYANDFESTAGGFTGNTGDAPRGLWEWGTPQVTAHYGEVFQADGCVQGSRCFYTGAAFSWDDRDQGDVDGGQSVAESPAFDLSGATHPVLSYKRWFVSLDLRYQPADRFDVMLSNGSDQFPLDSVTLSDSSWIESALPLADTIPLTSQMRVRFIATDLSANGDNLVEAAIDDLRVEEYECSLECAGVPVADPESLRARKTAVPGEVGFQWEGTGPGQYNLHRTDRAGNLPNLHLDGLTVVRTSATTSAVDDPPAGTDCWYYSMYARDCDGNSVPR